jgi:hypothetical protein
MLTIMSSVSLARIRNSNQFHCLNTIAKIIHVTMLNMITLTLISRTQHSIKVSKSKSLYRLRCSSSTPQVIPKVLTSQRSIDTIHKSDNKKAPINQVRYLICYLIWKRKQAKNTIYHRIPSN